jgi:hypothetical protein
MYIASNARVCIAELPRMLAPLRDSSTLAEKQYTADQPGLAAQR